MSERGDVLVGEVMSRDIKNIDSMATVADAIMAMKAAKMSMGFWSSPISRARS
jgi:hypothetical protein